jgi:hypothetical protein
LDVFAHALWSTAGGIAARHRLHWRIHLGWLAVWSVLPDLVVFAIPGAVRIGRFLTGASKTLLPDGSGPRFDWAFGHRNFHHQIPVAAFPGSFRRHPVGDALVPGGDLCSVGGGIPDAVDPTPSAFDVDTRDVQEIRARSIGRFPHNPPRSQLAAGIVIRLARKRQLRRLPIKPNLASSSCRIEAAMPIS